MQFLFGMTTIMLIKVLLLIFFGTRLCLCFKEDFNEEVEYNIKNFIYENKDNDGFQILKNVEAFLGGIDKGCSKESVGDVILNNVLIQRLISKELFKTEDFQLFIYKEVNNMKKDHFYNTKTLKDKISSNMLDIDSNGQKLIMEHGFFPILPILNHSEDEFYMNFDFNTSIWIKHAATMILLKSFDIENKLKLDELDYFGSMLCELLYIPSDDYKVVYDAFIFPVTIGFLRSQPHKLHHFSNLTILYENAFSWYLEFEIENSKASNPAYQFHDLLKKYRTRNQIGTEILKNNSIDIEYLEDYKNLGSYDGIWKTSRNVWTKIKNIKNAFTEEYLKHLNQIDKLDEIPNLDTVFYSQNNEISDKYEKVDALLISHCLLNARKSDFNFISMAKILPVKIDFSYYPAVNGFYMGYSDGVVAPVNTFTLPDGHFLFLAINMFDKNHRIYGFIQNNKTKHYTLRLFGSGYAKDLNDLYIRETETNQEIYEKLYDELNVTHALFKTLTFNMEVDENNIIKSELDLYFSLVNKISTEHRIKFEKQLNIMGFDETLTDHVESVVKNYLLPLVPFYLCGKSVVNKDIENAIPFCVTDVIFFAIPMTIDSVKFCYVKYSSYSDLYYSNLISYIGRVNVYKHFSEKFLSYLSHKFNSRDIVPQIIRLIDPRFESEPMFRRPLLELKKIIDETPNIKENMPNLNVVSKTITPETIARIIRFNKQGGRLRLLGGKEFLYTIQYISLLEKLITFVEKIPKLNMPKNSPYRIKYTNVYETLHYGLKKSLEKMTMFDKKLKTAVWVVGDDEIFTKCKNQLTHLEDVLDKIIVAIRSDQDLGEIPGVFLDVGAIHDFVNMIKRFEYDDLSNHVVDKLLRKKKVIRPKTKQGNSINQGSSTNQNSNIQDTNQNLGIDLDDTNNDINRNPHMNNGSPNNDKSQKEPTTNSKRPHGLYIDEPNNIHNVEPPPQKRRKLLKLPYELRDIEFELSDYIIENAGFDNNFMKDLFKLPKYKLKLKIEELFKIQPDFEHKIILSYTLLTLNFNQPKKMFRNIIPKDKKRLDIFVRSFINHVLSKSSDVDIVNDLTELLFFKGTPNYDIENLYTFNHKFDIFIKSLQTRLSKEALKENLNIINSLTKTNENVLSNLNRIKDNIGGSMENSFNSYKSNIEYIDRYIYKITEGYYSNDNVELARRLKAIDSLLKNLETAQGPPINNILDTGFQSNIRFPEKNEPHVHFKLPSTLDLEMNDMTIIQKSQDGIHGMYDVNSPDDADLTKWHILPLPNEKRLYLSVKANTIYDLEGIIKYINENFQDKSVTVLTGVHGSNTGDIQWVEKDGRKTFEGSEKLSQKMLRDRYQLQNKYSNIRNVVDISKMTEDDFINAIMGAQGHNIVITYCFSFNDEVLRKFLGRGNTILMSYVEHRFQYYQYEDIARTILKQKTNVQMSYLYRFMGGKLPGTDYMIERFDEIFVHLSQSERKSFLELLKKANQEPNELIPKDI